VSSTLAADVGAELEELETMRNASRHVERAGHELDWLTLRRQILTYGGIASNRDVKPEDVPGDLYRVAGKPADLVAAEACTGAPWGDAGDDSAMLAYLWRSWRSWDASKRANASSWSATGARTEARSARRAAPRRGSCFS
jgi:hypothetical protein